VNTNSTDQKQRLTPASDSKRAARKQYVKPEVRHERVFETMALSCGKVQTTQASCHFNRKTS
jgi:hypothetical protein